MTAQLFTPVELGGVTLPNRIVVSPMCQYSSVDGSAQPWHQVHYGMLSMSGAGLLCLEATHVEREGRITQGCAGLYSDENEAALKPVVDWARAWMPNVKLGIQLAHAGRKASAQRPWKGGGPLTQADAPDLPWTTCSASAIPFDTKWHTPVALDAVGPEARQAGLRRRHPAQRAAGLRRGRAARRARLSAQPVPVAAQQPSQRRVWRHHGEAPALPARSVRGLPQAVAARQGARHPPQLRRMGRGRLDHRGHDRDRAPAQGAGLRLRRCELGRQRGPPEDPARSRLSGAVRRAHPQGGRHQDLGGRRHHRAGAGRAHRRRGRGRLHRACPAVPARSALGLECRARAGRRAAALPLPAARATTILPFKPQPAMARAAD